MKILTAFNFQGKSSWQVQVIFYKLMQSIGSGVFQTDRHTDTGPQLIPAQRYASVGKNVKNVGLSFREFSRTLKRRKDI